MPAFVTRFWHDRALPPRGGANGLRQIIGVFSAPAAARRTGGRPMSPSFETRGGGRSGAPPLPRRDLLRRAGMGFGSLALASLLRDDGLLGAAEPGPAPAPVAGGGKAKSVIFLFMGGGPSHVDTWDPKPELAKLHGKDVPESIAKGIPLLTRSRLQNLHASPFRFTAR